MTRHTLAHHLVALNASADTVPSDIHLLPRGVFKGRDGRGPYRMPDPAKVIAATQAHQKGAKLPVDFDHQLECQRDGDIVRLTSVALTNKPNLDLIALNAENPAMSSSDPQDLLRLLRDLLGLADTADPASIVAALSETLDVSARSANTAATPNPRAWVPIGEYQRVCKELNTVDTRLSTHVAERHVDGLVETGHLFPFQREWAVSLCRADKDALDAFVSEVGPKTRHIFEALKASQITGPASRGGTVVDDTRRAVAEAMGLDPATMRTVPGGT